MCSCGLKKDWPGPHSPHGSEMPYGFVFADCINPKTGNTFREDNFQKTHKIPVGSLVEIIKDEEYGTDDDPNIGCRLRVILQTRDCDGTPLYSLGMFDPDREDRIFLNGYGEESLKIINPPA